MNKPITYRTMISTLLVILFCAPISAQELSSIEGRVLDENGELMQGVIVELLAKGVKQATAKTDQNGNFVVKPIKNGIYEVVARYPEYENVEIEDVAVHCGGPTKMNLHFTPKEFPELTECGMLLPPVFREPVEKVAITGKLKDAFNMPASNVRVEFYSKDTLRGAAVTNAKGCYRIDTLRPGDYVVITDFNGIKTIRSQVKIDTVEYVNEKVADLFFNKKIFDNHGDLVEHKPMSVLAKEKSAMKKP